MSELDFLRDGDYANHRLRAELQDLKEEIRMDDFCEQQVVPWQDVVSFLRFVAQHHVQDNHQHIFDLEL